MYITTKQDIINSTSDVLSVLDTFEKSLNHLNTHINNVHKEGEGDIIYLDAVNRVSIYKRGLIYGRTLKYVYQIISYKSMIEKETQTDEIYDDE